MITSLMVTIALFTLADFLTSTTSRMVIKTMMNIAGRLTSASVGDQVPTAGS